MVSAHPKSTSVHLQLFPNPSRKWVKGPIGRRPISVHQPPGPTGNIRVVPLGRGRAGDGEGDSGGRVFAVSTLLSALDRPRLLLGSLRWISGQHFRAHAGAFKSIPGNRYFLSLLFLTEQNESFPPIPAPHKTLSCLNKST
ncbi:hypothetical protein RRG08_009456 [Elysia crispata]|uniref:Uncharacterized protein n=1 Tax=Elysia crispata TaxID=231223 RepID=A0AAE0YWX0_9GAST|nr:hypothetical protein RRG08_009456 [Elysia crispata]